MKNKYLNRFDYFGQEIPQFTYKGQSKLGTPFGLIGTVLFTGLLLIYAISKFVHLVTFKNPLITKASEPDKHLSDAEAINLDENNF